MLSFSSNRIKWLRKQKYTKYFVFQADRKKSQEKKSMICNALLCNGTTFFFQKSLCNFLEAQVANPILIGFFSMPIGSETDAYRISLLWQTPCPFGLVRWIRHIFECVKVRGNLVFSGLEGIFPEGDIQMPAEEWMEDTSLELYVVALSFRYPPNDFPVFFLIFAALFERPVVVWWEIRKQKLILSNTIF